MMIPIEGEVEWRLPEGKFPYRRGKFFEAALRKIYKITLKTSVALCEKLCVLSG